MNDPFCRMTLLAIELIYSFCSDAAATGAAKIVNAFEWPGQPPKMPFSLGDLHLHLIHGSLGLRESSSKTACRSVQPFSYGSQMLCCTVHCQWRRKTQKLPHLLGFCHPAGGGPSLDHMQHAQKCDKDRACGSGICICSRTDRQTHTLTDTHSQYFTTAPAGKVKNTIIQCNTIFV